MKSRLTKLDLYVFVSDGTTQNNAAGVIALEFWCVYFAPVCVLSIMHFVKKQGRAD